MNIKNQFNDISVFVIQDNSKPEQERTKELIVVQYSASGGTAYALHGYTTHVIGKASGYGYDRTHTALLEAIETLTGKKIENVSGAQGYETVKAACADHDIELLKLTDLIYK